MTEAELKEALEYDAKRRELERAAFQLRLDTNMAEMLKAALAVNAAELREDLAKVATTSNAHRAEDIARHEADRKVSFRIGIASGLLANHSPIPTEPEAMRRYARQALQMADVLVDEARK
jgi:hypothetical protein